MSFQELLDTMTRSMGIILSLEQIAKFNIYKDFLLSWNKKINLTSITSDQDVAEKHFLDSLAALPQLNNSKIIRIIDIGSGAGLPGIPLNIVCSDKKFFLVESVKKKADFLSLLIKELRLDKTTIICERVEVLGGDPDYRASFDCALARAVSSLSVLAEYSLPLLKLSGQAVFWKGPMTDQEKIEGEESLDKINGKIREIIPYLLSNISKPRNLVIIQKTGLTPNKFPRKPGRPEKKPAHLL